MTDIAMRIVLSAIGSSAVTSAVQQVTSALGGSSGGSSGSGLAGALAGVGVAAAGMALTFGAASVKAAGDFEATINKVQALAGVSADEAAKAKDALLSMAGEVGQTPQQLADGLYYVASAGYNAKDSLVILEGSAKAAAVGMTDTETIANAVTASLHALGKPASETQNMLDLMTKTVSMGKTEWDDYAKVVGKIALESKQAGVSFEEANAAFAQLTNVMPSSKLAADGLSALLQTSSRFDLLAQRADKLKISFDSNKYASMNLTDRMRYLMQITGGNTEELTKLLGRQNAMRALTALSTNDFKDFANAVAQVKDNAGAADAAFDKTSGGLNMSMKKLEAAWESLKVSFGTTLLPLITPLVQGLSNLVAGLRNVDVAATPLGKLFSGIAQAWQGFFASRDFGPIVQGFQDLGATVKGVMEGDGFKGFASIITAISNVLLVLAQNILPMVPPVLGILKQYAEEAGKFMAMVGEEIATKLGPALQNLITEVAPIVQAFIEWVEQSGIVRIMFAYLSDAVKKLIDGLAVAINIIAGVIHFFVWLNETIHNFAEASVQFVISAWTRFSNWWRITWTMIQAYAAYAWQVIISTIQNAWSTLIGWFQSAGKWIADTLQNAWAAVVGGFQWLYDHNYIVKSIVDTIVGWWNWMVKAVQDGWNFCSKWLSDRWGDLVGIATAAWDMITRPIIAGWNAALFWIQSAWDIAAKWLSDRWNEQVQNAKNLWSQISGVFGGIWNTYIKSPLEKWWTDLTTWWNGLQSKAAELGSKLVKWIADKIGSIGGAIGQAIHDAISSGLKTLGFHDIPGWVGHAEGIMNSPVGHFAVVGEKGPELMYVPRGSSIFPNGSFGSVSAGGGSSGGGGGHTFIINISTMAGSPAEVRRMVDLLEREMAQRFRLQYAQYSTGGVF